MDFLKFNAHVVPPGVLRSWLSQFQVEHPFPFPGQLLILPDPGAGCYYATFTIYESFEAIVEFLKNSNISFELLSKDELPLSVQATVNMYFGFE